MRIYSQRPLPRATIGLVAGDALHDIDLQTHAEYIGRRPEHTLGGDCAKVIQYRTFASGAHRSQKSLHAVTFLIEGATSDKVMERENTEQPILGSTQILSLTKTTIAGAKCFMFGVSLRPIN